MAPWVLVAATTAMMLASASAFGVAGGLAGAGVVGSFLGWAFQGVGPSTEAQRLVDARPPAEVEGGLLFGGETPVIALYCGAKVRRASYAPLAEAVLKKLGATPDAGVLILQSPGNIYAFKPTSVAEVLEKHPTVTCIAGHSIGGLWAAEFCEGLERAGQWPSSGLDFFYMGVHGKGVSLEPFKRLPFRKVGWSYASEDCTMLRAAEDDVQSYVKRIRAELPPNAEIFHVEGGNHENYGSYGSPGPARGFAYKDLPAMISEEEQRDLVASAIVTIAQR